MSDYDCRDALRRWYERPFASEATACEDGPKFYDLVEWARSGRGLSPDELAHVQHCPRCRRTVAAIRRELVDLPAAGLETEPAGKGGQPLQRWGTPVYRVYRIGGALAAAACIALIFVSWPRPSFDAEIAVFGNAAYLFPDSSAMRGEEEGAPTAARPEEPSWLEQVLSDPEVEAAIGEQHARDSTILLEMDRGRLRLDPDGRLGLAEGVDETTAGRDGLIDLIDQDRAATEQIVDALIRHLPAVKEKNRPALRRALARYRAEKVFGTGQ